MTVQIAIAGVSGRMGRALIEAVAADAGCVLCVAIDRPASPLLGQDAGVAWGTVSGVQVTDQPATALRGAQVLIDFTRPEATFAYLDACVAAGIPLVIGTTGFDGNGKARIAAAARHIPIVFAPNMSVGVNLLMKLAELAAQVLEEGYDIEIIEAHHRHKIDAPSGTAMGLGQAVAGAIHRDLAQCAIYGREGVTGERDPKTIGFS
ncbi:MAG: 4-hydroxy-tetrahydrodipicolinate reductase, partial [Thiobacillus sp.]|nr:4-hydroxy-tetrahydrodipicolinate reductase [Thiobacillus sp.]